LQLEILLTCQQLLTGGLLMMAVVSDAFAQKKASPSQPYPAPRITGSLAATDGARVLMLRYQSKTHTFTGVLHSPCMLPASSGSDNSKPLDLSSIPIGTQMTAYYTRRTQKGKPDSAATNVILAIRFERVPRGSALPSGVVIPCVKAGR
jgi:hypothetical protein